MNKKFAFVFGALIAATIHAETIEDTTITRISRSDWNAQLANSTGLSREDKAKTRFIIGHTASPIVAQTRLGAEMLAKHIQDFHMNDKKWADIAYHFLIGDGIIVEGRTLDAMPSCYLEQNSQSVCAAFMGCFDDSCNVPHGVTKPMLVAMGVVLAETAWNLGIHDLSRENVKAFSELPKGRFPAAPGNRIMTKDENGISPFDTMIGYAVSHMMTLHRQKEQAKQENTQARDEV